MQIGLLKEGTDSRLFFFADWLVIDIVIKLFLFFSNFPLCELKGNEIIFFRLFPLERWWKIILFFSSIFLKFFTYYLTRVYS